jgi:Gluconate 2-dehydrogenase subunit 3
MSTDYTKVNTACDGHNDNQDSGVSRRTVLVTIGQAAIFSNGLIAETKAPTPLPPGVYLPSSDHLGHVLMWSGRFRPIPTGCPTDYVVPRTSPYTPLFFSPEEFKVIIRVTQLILGEPLSTATNTDATATQEVAEWVDIRVASAAGIRGAATHIDPFYRDLAIAYFGSERVDELENGNPEKTCREGLEWLSNAAKSRHSDPFLSLAQEQQVAILNSISDARPDKQNENAGTRFFTYMKAEVIRGYYTSQAGLKELDFKGNGFYAQSPGCGSTS